MSKTILVTGGSGFIGTSLSLQLLDKGHSVISLDNFSTGKRTNLSYLKKHKGFTSLEGDVVSSKVFAKLSKMKFDAIFHFASPAHVEYVTKYPVEAALVNSIGTKYMLDLAKEQHIRMIYASSSEAYGDPKEHPQKESYWGNVNPSGIRSGYDEGKRFSEALCMAYYREYGVSVGIGRIFNTYGPYSNENDSRIIPSFITKALRNEPLLVHGDGKQTRSFCYVDDTAAAFVKLFESEETGPFNIGNPDEYSVLDIANAVIKATGTKSKIKFIARPQDDPSLRKPEISLIKKKLQWKPTVSFEIGLANTVSYFRELLPQTTNE